MFTRLSRRCPHFETLIVVAVVTHKASELLYNSIYCTLDDPVIGLYLQLCDLIKKEKNPSVDKKDHIMLIYFLFVPSQCTILYIPTGYKRV